MTETETRPALDRGSGTGPLKRHIVRRTPSGLEDKALCGAAWDRAIATAGELCEPCVTEYRRIRPGWPLPGKS